MSKEYKNYILNSVKLKNNKTLILRNAMEEDAKDIIEYLNAVGGESDNLLFGKNEFRLNESQEKEHIAKLSKNKNALMLVALIGEKIVSVCQITTSDRKRIAHNSELAVSVRKDYWGIGIGSAIMNELIEFGKRNDNIKTISLGVRGSNYNAIKLYEKCGFEKVGCHKNYFNINGEFDDEILMDLYI
ncbi:MAG: GNAT family N-acetyltransferase [Romboutsia sp.]|uniref:GNAT family N-acetyltransferase n=1 Tax=Romboutsia sp. TaxID=1965302 RepID=UPI003F369BCF